MSTHVVSHVTIGERVRVAERARALVESNQAASMLARSLVRHDIVRRSNLSGEKEGRDERRKEGRKNEAMSQCSSFDAQFVESVDGTNIQQPLSTAVYHSIANCGKVIWLDPAGNSYTTVHFVLTINSTSNKLTDEI